MTSGLIQKETEKKNNELQDVIQCYKTNQWHKIKDTHRSLWSIRDEITVTTDNIVSCIVIPNSLQDRVIELAHQGHQGISKTKVLLRSKVWFPKINEKTEATVKGCLPCQASAVTHTREPLQMRELHVSQMKKIQPSVEEQYKSDMDPDPDIDAVEQPEQVVIPQQRPHRKRRPPSYVYLHDYDTS